MPARFPVRKTGSAFAKPVDPILGQTIPFAAIGAVRRQDQRQTLTQTCADAGYFSRNVRAIEVLIDRDAVASSAAATDGIWQHHDLDPGYCIYMFLAVPAPRRRPGRRAAGDEAPR
jgi:hypothetical protein